MQCTMFCPLGIVIAVLGKISPWRIRVAAKKCDHCGACEKICAYRAISSASRIQDKAGFQCSLCMDCLPVCKHQAISLHSRGIPLSGTTTKHVFLVVLVVVHVVFVAFARV